MPDNQANPPAVQPLTFRQPIPQYAGDKDVVDWLRAFERWATSVGLDEWQKFRAVESALTAKALDWFALVDRDGDLADWDDFVVKIRDRFRRKATPQEMCRSLTDLKQGKEESVKDFVDRVSKVVLMFKEEAPQPTATTDAGRRLVKEARDGVFELLRTSLFTAGLRDGIKTHVLRQALTSWELVEEAAIRVESIEGATQARQGTSGRSINSLDEEQGVSAMQGRGGQRGRGRGRGRGNQRSMQIGRPSWLRDEMLPPGTCYKCGHQGHFGRDCITRVENYYWAKLAEKMSERQVSAIRFPQQNWVPQQQWPAFPPPPPQDSQGQRQNVGGEEAQGSRVPSQQGQRENPFREVQQEYSNAFQDF